MFHSRDDTKYFHYKKRETHQGILWRQTNTYKVSWWKEKERWKKVNIIETYDSESDVICMITGDGSMDDWILDSMCFFICYQTRSCLILTSLMVVVML